MSSHLCVAVTPRGLLAEASAADDRVLSKPLLYGERRGDEPALSLLGLHVYEQRGLGKALGDEGAKAYAQALDLAPRVHDLGKQALDLAHERLARRGVGRELVRGRGVRAAPDAGELPVRHIHVVANP